MLNTARSHHAGCYEESSDSSGTSNFTYEHGFKSVPEHELIDIVDYFDVSRTNRLITYLYLNLYIVIYIYIFFLDIQNLLKKNLNHALHMFYECFPRLLGNYLHKWFSTRMWLRYWKRQRTRKERLDGRRLRWWSKIAGLPDTILSLSLCKVMFFCHKLWIRLVCFFDCFLGGFFGFLGIHSRPTCKSIREVS